LSVTRKVKAILEANFVVVKMTRDSDDYITLPDRAQVSNEINADAFVSIHCNDADNEEAEGMETYSFLQGNPDLAASIQGGLTEIPGHKDRGVKTANFSVLRRTAAPAALVECEFINHAVQGKWLSTEKAADDLALAIARGILGFLKTKNNNI
jgi:N-acetylmuramoyl-L-alanine amidase